MCGLGHPVYNGEHEMVEFFELSSLERDDDDLDLRNAGVRRILPGLYLGKKYVPVVRRNV
jgi:hypothetical protein